MYSYYELAALDKQETVKHSIVINYDSSQYWTAHSTCIRLVDTVNEMTAEKHGKPILPFQVINCDAHACDAHWLQQAKLVVKLLQLALHKCTMCKEPNLGLWSWSPQLVGRLCSVSCQA
jgi:hypothetical protein